MAVNQISESSGKVVLKSSIVEEVSDNKKFLEGLSTEGKLAVGVFLTYAEKMRDRRLPEAPTPRNEMLRLQGALYNAIIRTVNRNDKDFTETWKRMLKVVETNRAEGKAFHDKKVYRFMESVEMNSTARTAFKRLINLMLITATAQGRANVIRTVNLELTCEYGLTDNGRQRIFAFYNQ